MENLNSKYWSIGISSVSCLLDGFFYLFFYIVSSNSAVLFISILFIVIGLILLVFFKLKHNFSDYYIRDKGEKVEEIKPFSFLSILFLPPICISILGIVLNQIILIALACLHPLSLIIAYVICNKNNIGFKSD